ncbi:hypothetical protein HDZ31DRAFT_28381 [Schizophyllum fasciatum]
MTSEVLALLLASLFAAGAFADDPPARAVPSAFVSGVPSAIVSAHQALASAAAEGFTPSLGRLPSIDDIKAVTGLNGAQIAQLPVRILNVPGYANLTDDGWNILFHGQAYRQPLEDSATLDYLASGFLPGKFISELAEEQQRQARNLTAAIYSLPVPNLPLTLSLYNTTRDADAEESPLAKVTLPLPTDVRGEFNQFFPLGNSIPRDLRERVHRLEVRTNTGELGNSSSYLVPPEGITFLADVDDVLRATRIYAPAAGLLNNTFANSFRPWLNMPALYTHWRDTIPTAHFHYLTTTPEPATRLYEAFTLAHYPPGSFDTRPWNFTTFDQTFRVRSVALRRALQTFPHRRFVLLGDTANGDVMRDYPLLAKEYGNVQCVLIRNVSATDSYNLLPYDTREFARLDNSTYFFFQKPDDLMGLDIAGGQCVNNSVPQHVRFGWQNLLTDLESGADPVWLARTLVWTSTLLATVLGAIALRASWRWQKLKRRRQHRHDGAKEKAK